jgi:hypothetical protein
MNQKYILGAIAAISLSGCVTTTEQQVTQKITYKTFENLDLYGSSHVIHYHTENRKLAVKAEEAFKGRFRDRSYYGAFAYSPSGLYSWESGHNTLRTAVNYALKSCQNFVRPGEAKCVIFATMVPKRYTDKNATTLSKGSTETYRKFQKGIGFRAIAVNDSGTTRSRTRDTLELAKQVALFDCNAKAKSYAKSYLKIHKCRILGIGEYE